MTLRRVSARLRAWASDSRDSAVFHLHPPKWDEVLSEKLPFGLDGEAAFRSYLASCHQYLEYGAGSSTLAAARAGVSLVSVESDSTFLSAVERRCRSLAPSGAGKEVFVHGNIGPIGPWGKPVVPAVSRPGIWRRYPMAPWQVVGEDFRADFILVDGRFRVACALAVIAHQPDTSWTLLVDDYVGRDHYGALTHFAELVNLHGRMAEFRPKPGIGPANVRSALERSISDWR